MCAPSSRLSATRMPAMRYRFALDTWEIRQARTVCLTNCCSNSEYSSLLLLRMSITLGNARRNPSSTVRPLMPRLYTCGSNRSSSRRRGILSQSCLMLFLVSVMHPLYLTETSETRTNYLESEHFSTLRSLGFACQQALASPPLVSTAAAPPSQPVSQSLGTRTLR